LKSVRAKTTISYHGRTGKPKIHWTEKGKPFIMVRKSGGGTKRLRLQTKAARKAITSGYSSLLAEARRRKP